MAQDILAFPSANIPVVGMPFEIKAWHVNILMMCKCENPQPVQLIGVPDGINVGAQGTCTSCKSVFILKNMTIQGIETQFQIAMARQG